MEASRSLDSATVRYHETLWELVRSRYVRFQRRRAI
jgi:hypothetical protein